MNKQKLRVKLKLSLKILTLNKKVSEEEGRRFGKKFDRQKF